MTSANCIAVIPARMKSTRLPGKPLQEIEGKTLVQRVWEQARQVPQLSRVIVASDDPRIVEHARQFGAEVALTREDHHTGSDRVAEVLDQVCARDPEPVVIANIQGDMPFISPELIGKTIESLLRASPEVGIATVASSIMSHEEFLKPSVVKVVCASDGRALYFSRAPIPFWREPLHVAVSEEHPIGLKHMGLYVFRPPALRQLTNLSPVMAEERERLEQLRALVAGIPIIVHRATAVQVHPSIEVDTPDDLERAREHARTMAL